MGSGWRFNELGQRGVQVIESYFVEHVGRDKPVIFRLHGKPLWTHGKVRSVKAGVAVIEDGEWSSGKPAIFIVNLSSVAEIEVHQ